MFCTLWDTITHLRKYETLHDHLKLPTKGTNSEQCHQTLTNNSILCDLTGNDGENVILYYWKWWKCVICLIM